MIEVQNISKSFSGKVVLNNISANFDRGKTNLIIGRSGSGKTVLLKCIVGLYETDEGEISYDNRNFSTMNFNKRKAIRQEIGMMFQGGALFDSFTVEENVIFPLNMFTKMPFEEKRERANFCLARVNIINANKLFPSEISGGMKKRVALARAIALQPKYLFCDEPNSGLDPVTAIIIDELIKELTIEFSITTIINTHDMNSVMGIGDKIIFIHEGHNKWEGSRIDILNTDNVELNNFVFASKILKKANNN